MSHLSSHCHTPSLWGLLGSSGGRGVLLPLGSLLPDLTVASFFVGIIVPPVVTSEPYSEPWAGIAGLGELP